MKPLIITHKNCVDGCCSKAILRKKFGNDAEYLELDHANLDPTKDSNAQHYLDKIFAQEKSEVYVSDFCLNTQMIEQLLKQKNKVIILDHHESSIPFVEPFEQRLLNGEKLNIDIHFAKKNHCSGSMLTWEYLNPGIEPPQAVKIVSDGDIWKFEFGDNTKYFYTGLLETFGEPKDIPEIFWDGLINNDKLVEEIIHVGKPIHQKYMKEVMSFVPVAKPIMLDGKMGLVVEANKKYTSDLGNQLALASGGFGLVYNIDNESGVVRCSLRSVAPFSVKDIAQKFGGGGHAQASAFRCKDLNEFKKLLLDNGNDIELKFKQMQLDLFPKSHLKP